MDTSVQEIGAAVVAALRTAGYMESTIGQYQKSIKQLEMLAAQHDGTYTCELGARFAMMTTSPRTGEFSKQRSTDYQRLIHLYDSYVLTGCVDLAVRKHPSTIPSPKTPEFCQLLSSWDQDMKQRELAKVTLYSFGSMATQYLTYLETQGISTWDKADSASVLGFLESLRKHWAETTMWSVVANFRPFLKFTQRTDLLDALALARAPRHHRIHETLDPQSERTVVEFCRENPAVSARDAAIVLLCLVSGLRACDVVNLKFDDVDWRGSTLGIVQQKTGNPLTLPLPALVLKKLADYVLHERPETTAPQVFIRWKAPHKAFGDHASIYRVISTVFRAAGVDHVKVGSRMLRYNAASNLLRAGTPLPTISAVLGHASADSTNVYLSTDVEQLLACVLPLPVSRKQ
ncbi:site-specific integrase [Glutamicibacter sp. 287]|uniref:site-specific integrase n=2 Tax=Glutamicibacter TaxID=1742989 RepID=UPI004033805E